jgi:hypothetical protein
MGIGVNRRTSRLASCFSERLWRPDLRWCRDHGQQWGRRHSRLGDNRSGTPVECKIREVHLRQHQDQPEQEQFEDKQDVTPPLLNSAVPPKKLFQRALPCQYRFTHFLFKNPGGRSHPKDSAPGTEHSMDGTQPHIPLSGRPLAASPARVLERIGFRPRGARN